MRSNGFNEAVDKAFAAQKADSINEAADWLNDALQDLTQDQFAAVLQAAIARRD